MLGIRIIDCLRTAVTFAILYVILPENGSVHRSAFISRKAFECARRVSPTPLLPAEAVDNELLRNEETFADVVPWDFIDPSMSR